MFYYMYWLKLNEMEVCCFSICSSLYHDPAGFSCSVFIMHNVGLVVGWTLMILLAYFESIMSGVVKAPVVPDHEPHV